MTNFEIMRSKLKNIPNEPYGSFSDEEKYTLDIIKYFICGQDIEKCILLDLLIDSHVKNVGNGEAYDNAGESI